jgi:hypothetical protein
MKKSAITLFALLASWALASSALAGPVKISQVYGGGGGSSGTYIFDYVELFNSSPAPVNIGGWSLQYGSSAGTSFGSTASNIANIPTDTFIAGCSYYLVQVGTAGTGGIALPVTPDLVNGTGPNMAQGAGKIALINNQVGGNACAGHSVGGIYEDVVGYGGANCFETASAAATTNVSAAVRKSLGLQDTDDNSADFDIIASAGLTIHNSQSGPNPNCQVTPNSPSTWGSIKTIYR